MFIPVLFERTVIYRYSIAALKQASCTPSAVFMTILALLITLIPILILQITSSHKTLCFRGSCASKTIFYTRLTTSTSLIPILMIEAVFIFYAKAIQVVWSCTFRTKVIAILTTSSFRVPKLCFRTV